MLRNTWSLVILSRLVECAILNVTVGGSGGLIYDPAFIDAEPGDTVRFIFKQKNHTVTQSTFEKPCEHLESGFDTGFIPVSDSEQTNFPIAQLNIHDKSPIWVYCRQGNHCQRGMVFAVNPANNFDAFKAAAMGNSTSSPPPLTSGSSVNSTTATAATTTPSGSSNVSVVTVTATVTATPSLTPSAAQAPTPTAFSVDHQVIVGGPGQFSFQPSSLKAQIGDTVTFQFRQSNHTVTQSSFPKPCEALSSTSTSGEVGFDSGFIPVADNAISFPTYSIHINDTKTIWAYCRQSDHCGRGMVFAINAPDEGPNTFNAFQTLATQMNGGSVTHASVKDNGVSSRKVDLIVVTTMTLVAFASCLL